MKACVYRDQEVRTPAGHMAADEALMRLSAGPVVREYRWSGRAVTFGYSQRIQEVREFHPGTPLVRRWTGGGMVEHGSDLTFTLFDPEDGALCGMRASESYEAIHQAVLEILQTREKKACLAVPEDVRVGEACFQNPSLHDVLLGPLKVCGGAQRRGRQGLLHQGSIQGVELPGDFGTRLAAALFGEYQVQEFGAEVHHLAGELEASRYGNPEWLARR